MKGNGERRDNRNSRQDRPSQGTRAPLEWETEHVLVLDNARCNINTAVLQNGKKLYSGRFLKQVGENGKPSSYFRDDEFEDVALLARRAKEWVDADKDRLAKDEAPSQ